MATAPSALHDACLPIAAALSLDPRLLEAVALVESGGRPDSLRFESAFYTTYVKGKDVPGSQFGPLAACSLGAMQIMLATACEIGFLGNPWDLFDLKTGLTWGAKYLAQQLEWAQGDTDRTLSAYNGGTGTASKGPPYANATYIARVHAALRLL